MAELVRTFQGGTMNKDLDERLVPNGAYVDALNIQVSDSQGSDVGAIENIQGNLERKYKSFNQNTGEFIEWSGGDFIPSNATCIATVKDEPANKIYSFITYDQADAIYEFNEQTNVIKPVLVDTANILKFSPDRLITGLTIIEGILYWTDGLTEPKQLDVSKWIDSAVSFLSHSNIYGRPFIEEDITVIRKHPLTPPQIELFTSFRNEPTNFTFTYDFRTTDSQGNTITLPNGSPVTIVANLIPNLNEGDTIECTTTDTDGSESVDIILRLQVVAPVYTTSISCIVASAPENIPSGSLLYEGDLVEPEGIFKNKFVRFAYRWKFNNNQYSAFSPFTQVAFEPGGYEWNTLKGYNLGMYNTIKRLKLSGFDTPPDDVERLEVLYKADNSASIYVVDDIDISETDFELDSELIYKNVEANQLLRPWDNVPRSAKALEFSANRLIFANYKQNYDFEIQPEISLSILENGTEPVPSVPRNSVKSLRTYQVGVVYQDEYGRQSPVFSSKNAGFSLEKEYSNVSTSFTAQIQSAAPSWATHFKYYIKDPSTEYYNLAMDRYYLAEDGNIWLSIPSSDRNKVTEEDFLVLKKQHSNDVAVLDEARFKIIAISNEAPLFLKTRRVEAGRLQDQSMFEPSGFPSPDTIFVDIDKDKWQDSSFNGLESESGLVIEFGSANAKSIQYEVASIALFTAGSDWYRVSLESKIQDDIEEVIGNVSAPLTGLFARIFKKKTENKPEFEGRFFIKLYRNASLNNNILSANQEEDYTIRARVTGFRNTQVTAYNEYSHWRYSSGGVRGGWQINNSTTYRPHEAPDPAPGIKVGATTISIDYHGARTGELGNTSGTAQFADFVQAIKEPGAKIRFTDDPNGEVYTTTGARTYSVRNFDKSWSSDSNWGSNKRTRFDLDLDKPIVWTPESILPLNDRGNRQSSATTAIELLSSFTESSSFTSTNPAVFETEPKEQIDLDIYFEGSKAYSISEHGTQHTLDFFNCVSFGNGVESNRIGDDFNAPYIAKGVKASAVLDDPYQEEDRKTGFIFSQIFNSRSGVNNVNQFIQALPITKDLNPIYGSIQKLYSRSKDGDLITLCEDKCLKVLANKDALFEADGSPQLISNQKVLGQAVPYVGEFGISTNPESFTQYAYRSYFTDKSRGVVLRLSGDGLEEISRYGMGDFFADNLAINDKLIGSFDGSKGVYNLTLNNLTSEWEDKLPQTAEQTTVSFKEDVNGWSSRKSYIPESGLTLNNKYYTFKKGRVWEHEANTLYNNFYGLQYVSTVNVPIANTPLSVKGYKTLNYTGTEAKEYKYNIDVTNREYSIAEIRANNLLPITQIEKDGWWAETIVTDLQEGQVDYFLNKEGKWFNNIKGKDTFFNTNIDNNVDTNEFTVQGIGRASVIDVPPITIFDVTVFIDNSCSTEVLPPLAGNMTYTLVEDCDPSCVTLQLAASDPNNPTP